MSWQTRTVHGHMQQEYNNSVWRQRNWQRPLQTKMGQHRVLNVPCNQTVITGPSKSSLAMAARKDLSEIETKNFADMVRVTYSDLGRVS